MLTRWMGLLLICVLLSACAVPRTVDSTVQTYSTLAGLPQPPTYRLMELPSQQANPRSFATIAPLAHASLARVGLQRDDAAPRLIAEVEVGMRTGYLQGPWYPNGPWGGSWGPGWSDSFGAGYGWGGGLRAGALLRDMPPTIYRHEVRLVLRDAQTQHTVYETSAFNEDVWTDTPTVFGVLLDAALAGFPNPPEGPRNVRFPLRPNESGAATPAVVVPSASLASPALPDQPAPAR